MSFEEYKAELALLLNQLNGDPGDEHEIQMRLHTMINTLRAEGLPVPEDLAHLEEELNEKFSGN